jgi:putative glycosyltransferase
MKLSIVSTLYRSSAYLDEFVRRVSVAAERVTDDWEIILVNDGSPDDSLEKAVAMTRRTPGLTVIDLSRNFGHHKAMMAGLAQATGGRTFLLDCDLEEPPELLVDFWERMDAETDLDVVYGIQRSRRGGWFTRASGWLFYRLINWLSPVSLHPNAIVARLMSRRYLDALTRFGDQEIYLFGLMVFAGFKQQPMPVEKLDKGSSSYTIFRRFALFFNALTSFTNYPLYAIVYLGLTMSLFSFAYVVYVLIHWMLYADVMQLGWSSLIVSVWATGGLTLTALGVLGIYIAKIFAETKDRPRYVIREVYRSERL